MLVIIQAVIYERQGVWGGKKGDSDRGNEGEEEEEERGEIMKEAVTDEKERQ